MTAGTQGWKIKYGKYGMWYVLREETHSLTHFQDSTTFWNTTDRERKKGTQPKLYGKKKCQWEGN